MNTHRTHKTVHELELRDIEFLEDGRPARWQDVLDTLDESGRDLGVDRRWEAAMEHADTRIWIRPYAARFD